MELTAQNVSETFRKCLFKDGEDTSNHVIGEGVMMKIGFHPERLKEKTQDIENMISCLHDNFKANIGGGWSFLNLCEDKNGNQWADMHQTMDELVCLGNAIGKINFLMPRELWKMFPGGMPYVVVK